MGGDFSAILDVFRHKSSRNSVNAPVTASKIVSFVGIRKQLERAELLDARHCFSFSGSPGCTSPHHVDPACDKVLSLFAGRPALANAVMVERRLCSIGGAAEG